MKLINYDGKLVSQSGVVVMELSKVDDDKLLQHFPRKDRSRVLTVVDDGNKFSIRLNTGYEVLSCYFE